MRSLYAVFLGTFTLRFSTGLTGGLLLFYLARLHRDFGGPHVDETTLAVMTATFYAAELVLATPFGLLSDRLGHNRIMQIGPLFGVVAAVLTWASTNLVVIGGLGSFWGVVVAGLLVGVVRGITVLFYPPAAEASMYILMILVLLFRPRGLMGERFEKFE